MDKKEAKTIIMEDFRKEHLIFLPNLSNVWQLTLKDTALISVTGLVEIMRQSYIASGVTRNPLLFYCFAAFLYLILTTISLKYFNKLEKKYNFYN